VHRVIPGDLLVLQQEADRGRHTGANTLLDLRRAEPVTAAIVPKRGTGRFSSSALRIELLPGAEAAVRFSGGEQTLRVGLMLGRVLTLEVRPFIPGDTQPGKSVQNDPGMLGSAPLAIGILDAQHVSAAGVAGKEPVEQRGAGTPDVEVSGG
jgi:hypothetical protein